MESFSLMRLPYFAFQEVLKCLDPIELILLSKCSRRVYQLIPIGGTSRFRLSIDFRGLALDINGLKIRLKERPGVAGADFSTFERAEKSITFYYNEIIDDRARRNAQARLQRSLTREMENVKRVTKVFIFQILDLFKCKAHTFTCNFKHSSMFYRSLVKEILKKQMGSIEKLKIDGEAIKNDDMKWLIGNVNVTSDLIIDTFRTSVSPLLTVKFPSTCKCLRIEGAGWINLKQMLSLKEFNVIYLNLPEISSNDLKEFIDEWKAGNFPKLEYMALYSVISFESSIIKLGFTLDQANTMREVIKPKIYEGKLLTECDKGVDIKSNNGTLATIQLHRDGFDNNHERFDIYRERFDMIRERYEFIVWKN